VGPFRVHRAYDNKVTYLVGDDYNIQNRLVHVSRLAPYYRRIHGAPPQAPVEQYPQLREEEGTEEKKDDAEREWPIRQLMGRRSKRGQLEYLVEWEGPYAASWEPAEALPMDFREVYDGYIRQTRSYELTLSRPVLSVLV
jgi:hypothetical protein